MVADTVCIPGGGHRRLMASIGVTGTNGLGAIKGSSLEMSNVNISAEFSSLIIAQRGFEANSKAITTFDTIAQETINMIHYKPCPL